MSHKSYLTFRSATQRNFVIISFFGDLVRRRARHILSIKFSTWMLGIGIDCGRTFGFIQSIGSFVLLSHAIDDEHHTKNGTQQANNGASNDGYKKERNLINSTLPQTKKKDIYQLKCQAEQRKKWIDLCPLVEKILKDP